MVQGPVDSSVRSRLIFLVIILSSVYYATLSGITCSNDGSHWALLRAIVDGHTLEISEYEDYTEANDFSQVGTRLYSDRPPGTALLATPFYAVGKVLPAPGRELPSRHDRGNPAMVYALLLPVLAGCGAAVLLFLFLLRLGVRTDPALLASLALGLGTAWWKYSTVLFSHVVSGLLILGSVMLLQRVVSGARRSGLHAALAGLLVGLSVTVEYPNLIFVAIASLWLLLPAATRTREGLLRRVLPFAIGLAGPVLFLAVYNGSLFGGPFNTSYSAAASYPWARSLTTTFGRPLVPGVLSLLFFPWNWDETTHHMAGVDVQGVANQGLLLLSPILWLALPGAWRHARMPGQRWTFTLIGVTFLFFLLLFAKHETMHGYTRDGRYLVCFLPLLAVWVGFGLQWLLAEGAPHRLARHLLVYLLLFLSIRNAVIHIGTSFNYPLHPAQFRAMAADPRDLLWVFRAVLPNHVDLPRLWLGGALVVIGVLAIGWLRRRAASPEPPAAGVQ